MNDKIATLKKYLKDNPDDSFTRFALALELLKQDETDKARKLFEAIRNDDPDYVGVYYHLGKLYESQDKVDRAIDIYDEGIEVAQEQNEQRTLSELQEAKSLLKWDDE